MTTTTISLTADQVSILMDTATTVGAQMGRSYASWVEVDSSNAQAILDLIENCEIDVPTPLSGEWADDPTPDEVLAEIVSEAHLLRFLQVDDLGDVRDDLLVAFEMGVGMGYEDHLGERCSYHLA